MSRQSSLLNLLAAAGLAQSDLERERARGARDAAVAQAVAGGVSGSISGLTGAAEKVHDEADKDLVRGLELDRLVGPGQMTLGGPSVVPAGVTVNPAGTAATLSQTLGLTPSKGAYTAPLSAIPVAAAPVKPLTIGADLSVPTGVITPTPAPTPVTAPHPVDSGWDQPIDMANGANVDVPALKTPEISADELKAPAKLPVWLSPLLPDAKPEVPKVDVLGPVAAPKSWLSPLYDMPVTADGPKPVPVTLGVPTDTARNEMTGTLRPGVVLTPEMKQPIDDAEKSMDEDARNQLESAINSGVRTHTQQAALYANRANNPYPVAAPGTSDHEVGKAIDVDLTMMDAPTRSSFLKTQDDNKAAGKSYYAFNTPNDKIHGKLMDGTVADDAPRVVPAVANDSMGPLPGETRDAFKTRAKKLGLSDDDTEMFTHKVFDTSAIRDQRRVVAAALEGKPGFTPEQILAGQDAIAPLPADNLGAPTSISAKRPSPSDKPLSEPSAVSWKTTPEQDAEAYLAERGVDKHDNPIAKFLGVDNTYDLHKRQIVNAIVAQRHDYEQKYFQSFRDAQKLDLDRRVGESVIAKNYGEADKASNEGGHATQMANVVAGAMRPMAARLKDQLNSDDPNEVVAAQKQLKDEGNKALLAAGVNLADPKQQVLIQSALGVGIDDTMKGTKKRDLEPAYLDGIRAASDNIDAIPRLTKLRKDAAFQPNTLQIMQKQINGVAVPVVVGGVLTFDIGKVMDKLGDLRRRGEVTPAQYNYLAEAYALKNNLAKVANAGFNLTDGDMARIDVGLFDPYSTAEEYDARMKSMEYDMTKALKNKVDDLNPTFKVPTTLAKTIQGREIPTDYTPAQPGAFGAETGKAFGKRSDASSGADAFGANVGDAASALVPAAIGAVGAGLGHLGNGIDTASKFVDKQVKKVDGSSAPPVATPGAARLPLDLRLGGRLLDLQKQATKAGVDPAALAKALAASTAAGADLYTEGQNFIFDNKRK